MVTVAHFSNSGGFRVLICGYYGEHNLGDDALLAVLLNELESPWIPVITARDQQAVASMTPGLETVNRRSLRSVLQALKEVDVLVLGGGSLLQDSTSTRSLIYYILLIWRAKLLQKPVVLWGQGLGPLKRRLSKLLVRSTLRIISSVTWRDSASLNQSMQWKLDIPMMVGPDPVWGHPAPEWKSGSSLILCWRPTPLLSNLGWLQLINALCEFSEMHDFKVIWLAFHDHQDINLLDDLEQQRIVPQKLMNRSTTIAAESIPKVQNLFRESRMVIAMRLHALILAAIGGVPTSALSYDPKVTAAADQAKILCTELSNQLSEQQLVKQWNEAMNSRLNGENIKQLADSARIHSQVLNNRLKQLL